jgi:hypothetical protein
MRTALSKQTLNLALAGFLLYCALFAGAATAQQGDPTQRIAQIDSTITQWNSYLSDLYRYVKQDPQLLWRYNNDPNYKTQYDAWVNYEWQRGQQAIQQLQWQRGQETIQQPQSSELERYLFPPSRPQGGQTTSGSGSTGSGNGGTTSGSGSTSSGTGLGGTGPMRCRDGSLAILGVCGGTALPRH